MMQYLKQALFVVAVIAAARAVQNIAFPVNTSDAAKNASNAKIREWLP